MKYKNKNLLLRGLSLLLAALITITSVDVSAYAVPNNKAGNSIEASYQLSDELESQVQEAYKALLKAYKTGKKSDFITACKLIAKLSPTQSVRLFVLKYENYYKQNYLKDDFAYFDVNKYLLAHPELIDSKYPVSYNREKALEHYLEYGIYKGDSSCTKFDPIVAIIVQPAECVKAIVNDSAISATGLESIKEAYTLAEGSDNTLSYDLSSSFGEAANGKFKADDGILYIGRKNKTPATSVVVEEQVPYSEDKSGDDTLADNTPVIADADNAPIKAEGLGGDPENKQLINNKARENVFGYKLHVTPEEILSYDDFDKYIDSEGHLLDLKLDYTKTTGYKYEITYVPRNYYYIANKDASQAKYENVKDNAKCTVMYYLCGTDLEDGPGLATKSIVDMLKSKYDTSKVNVLICAGGTNTWKPGALEENNGAKCSIYYLDPEASTDGEITNTSLLKLTDINTPIEMGQSELLLGFMDMAYDLFPADNYWLSFWNHGGGAKQGVCFSDLVEGNKEITSCGLSLAKVEEALASSKIFAADKKLGVLSFDACMMGGIEEAYNISRYADYMVGSAELSSGDLDYSGAFKYICDLPEGAAVDNKEVAKKASYGYIKDKEQYYAAYTFTESVVDLSKMDKLNEHNEDLANCLNSLLEDTTTSMDAYRMIRMAAVRSKNYGSDGKRQTAGYLDYYDFLIKLDAYLNDLSNTSNSSATKATCNKALADIKNIIDYKFILESDISYANQIDSKAATGAQALSLKEVATAHKQNSSLNYNKIFSNYLGGMSIFFPINDNSYLYTERKQDAGTHSAEMDNYLNEAVFKHYAGMLGKADSIANSPAEVARLEKVAKALINSGSTNNGIIDSITRESYTSAPIANGSTYEESIISINFKKDYSNTSYANDGVHNDPFTDFVDVVKDINLLGLKNVSTYNINAADEWVDTGDNYDVIIASSKIQPSIGISSEVTYGASGINDSTKLRFDMAPNSLIGYLVEGARAYFNSEKKEYEKDTENRFFHDWGHMLTDSDKAQYDIKYDTLGSPHYNSNNVFIFDGKYYYVDNGEETIGNGLIAFEKINNEKYSYLGVLSAKTADDNSSYYNKTEGVDAISFDHYTVNDEGKVVKLEDIIADGSYLKTPVFIIDGSNTPVIKEQTVVGYGELEDNSKLAVEINVNIPVVGSDDNVYFEEQSVVFKGDNELYLNPAGDNGTAKEKYEASEALEYITDAPVAGSGAQSNPDPSVSSKAPETSADEITDTEDDAAVDEATPVASAEVSVPASDLDEQVDVVLNDDEVILEDGGEDDEEANDEALPDTTDEASDNTDNTVNEDTPEITE